MTSAASKRTAPREAASRESARSGRLLLRMPRPLHAELAARSDAAGLSLNQYIVETLSKTISGEAAAGDLVPHVARPPRSLRLALLANAIVVALAAATCVVLLLVALR